MIEVLYIAVGIAAVFLVAYLLGYYTAQRDNDDKWYDKAKRVRTGKRQAS